MALLIRRAVADDAAAILALNAASTPALAEMDAATYAAIAGWAEAMLVAQTDGAFAGFIALIAPGSAYPSDNYAWFEANAGDHLYIDRVAVAERSWGQGVGRALYVEAERLAVAKGRKRLSAEINVDPPNPESRAFHQRLGFRELEVRMSRSGKLVVMVARELA